MPRIAPPYFSNLLGLELSKSARYYAQSPSDRVHDLIGDDAMPP
jgi:hypothetical protein